MFRQYVKQLIKFGSIKQFRLPDLGEKIKEATIKQWHVKIGDKVEEFQPVADVATDKMFTQIPSSYNGIIHKIFHEVEESCLVGEIFLEIDIQDDHQQSIATKQTIINTKGDDPIKNSQSDQSLSQFTLATPAVRRIAKEKQLDLTQIRGSGQDGRILTIDLETQLVNQILPLKKENMPKKDEKIIQQVQSKQQLYQNHLDNGLQIKMSDFQRGMQKTMTESNTIPTLYLKDEYDLSALSEMREQMKKLGIPITFMSFFIKAFSLALLQYPILNSTYDIQKPFEYKLFNNHNISLALDSPQGLVVPNIKSCQNLTIIQINDELKRLKKLGEKGQLSMKDLQDGTICLSNIGTIGGTYTGPLILPPQICIVGIGKIFTEPRYDQRMNIIPKKLMNFSFGCDHRVVDGATVTRFSNLWKNYLENPNQILIHLK